MARSSLTCVLSHFFLSYLPFSCQATHPLEWCVFISVVACFALCVEVEVLVSLMVVVVLCSVSMQPACVSVLSVNVSA